jgi:hypothetical protein
VERTVSWLRRHANDPVPTTTPPSDGPRAALAAVVAFLLAIAGNGWAQPVASADEALAAFAAATRDYAQLHRRVEQQLGPVDINARPEAIARAIELMAAAMREARPQARQGDFFTPALVPYLRSKVARALADAGLTRDDVRISELVEGIDSSAATLRVHDMFPWALCTPKVPCVMAALPDLPPELQYRIVGDHLVLVDVHASLIVDVLPDALRDPGTPNR